MPSDSIIQRLEEAGVTVRDDHAERRLKVIQATSASQIERWSQCPRQWFGGYVEGDWAPQTDAQKRGTAVDLEVQKHYRGEPVHAGWREAVQGIVKLLPAGVVIQQKVVTPTYDGGPVLIGYPDFLYEEAPGDVFVDDLKSTSDFRYAKTAEQLRAHIQPISYSAWLWTIPEVKRVRARHVVAKFDKDERSPVGYRFRGARLSKSAEMDRDHVRAQWEALHDDVRAMVQAARQTVSFDDLPALGASDVDEFGKTGCERFGGCHFRSRCGLDVLGGGKKQMSGMSLMDRLNAAKAQQAGVSTPAVSQPMVTKEGQPYVVVQPIPSPEQPADAPGYRPKTEPIPGALTGDGRAVERIVNPNHAHPGDVGVDGYAKGQPCNGNGYYASSNGQGFIAVEPGHACTVCQPGRVLPPDAPSRTSTSAESDAAEEKVKKRGRPKKEPEEIKIGCSTCSEKIPASQFEAHLKAHQSVPAPTAFEPKGETDSERGYRLLTSWGFTVEEVNLLNQEGAMEDALAGKITPGMLRQPTERPKDGTAKAAAGAMVVVNPSAQQSAPPKPMETSTPTTDQFTAREQLTAFQEAARAQLAPVPPPVTVIKTIPIVSAGSGREDAFPLPTPVAPDRVQEHLKALRKAPPKAPPVAPTIYVDCHPVKGAHKASVVDAADWVGPIAELAALAHVDRDSGKPAPLDDVFLAPFGTGKAVLAAALRECLDGCPAVLAIDSSSPAQQVALDVLRPHAAVVVQAKGGR